MLQFSTDRQPPPVVLTSTPDRHLWGFSGRQERLLAAVPPSQAVGLPRALSLH